MASPALHDAFLASTHRRVKTVGLVGFFGWGNFGDELFLEVHRTYLGSDFDLRVLHDRCAEPYHSRDLSEIVEEVDAIVIGGGDLIYTWSYSGLYWRREYLSKPVFIVGVGATDGPAKPEAVRKYTEFLTHPSVAFCNLRDRESYDYVRRVFSPTAVCNYSADIVFGLS